MVCRRDLFGLRRRSVKNIVYHKECGCESAFLFRTKTLLHKDVSSNTGGTPDSTMDPSHVASYGLPEEILRKIAIMSKVLNHVKIILPCSPVQTTIVAKNMRDRAVMFSEESASLLESRLGHCDLPPGTLFYLCKKTMDGLRMSRGYACLGLFRDTQQLVGAIRRYNEQD